jgi:hypothetical protein
MKQAEDRTRFKNRPEIVGIANERARSARLRLLSAEKQVRPGPDETSDARFPH